MKKMFIEAHKMTKEMVRKYGVDYQTQFGLNLSYLLEKKEEVKMLKEEIRKELEKMEVAQEEIERAKSILGKYRTLTNELVKDLYSDATTRRSMKAKKLWDDKTTGLEFEKRYLGEGKVEISKQILWAKGDKIRIYFDVTVDGQFTTTSNFIKIK